MPNLNIKTYSKKLILLKNIIIDAKKMYKLVTKKQVNKWSTKDNNKKIKRSTRNSVKTIK